MPTQFKYLLLLLIMLPLTGFAQPKYSGEAKRLFNKGLKEFKNNNREEALQLFQECVKLEPAYAEAYLNISIIHYDNENVEEALGNASLAYKNNKFNPSIYSHLGKCYYHIEQYDSAAFFLAKAIELGEENEFNLIYSGKSHYEIEDYETAEEHLRKAIKLNHENPVPYNDLGKIHFKVGEYLEAEAAFTKAIEINPESVSLYTNLSNVYLRLSKPDEAIKTIQQGMNKADEENQLQLLILLGNYYHYNEAYDSAMVTYDKALKIDSENARIVNNQAAVLLDQGQYQSALEKCNVALDLDPELMEAYFNRGIANEMLRNVLDACSDWEQAFILGSEKAEEYLNSATCNE